MSNEKHTKEPWLWDDRRGDQWDNSYLSLSSESGPTVMDVSDDYPGYAECGQDLRINIKKEDAERIVDCVNSCAGINPEAVPKMLEALEVCNHFIENALNYGVIGQHDAPKAEYAEKKAKAALALAGKESE